MNRPWLSIIIPVYNPPLDLFQKCLESLQTISIPMEVLLIDDGSNTETQRFCETVVVSDNRIRCIHQDNQGVSCARTNGISEAEGKYIFFLDSDDAVSVDWCKYISENYDTLHGDWIIFDAIDYFPQKNKYVSRNIFQDGTSGVLSAKDTLHMMLSTNKLCECWGKLISAELLNKKKIEFPNGVAQGEDFIFNLKIVENADKILAVNRAAYIYRYELKNTERLLRNPSKYLSDLVAVCDEQELAIKVLSNAENRDDHVFMFKQRTIDEIGSDIIKLMAANMWTEKPMKDINTIIMTYGLTNCGSVLKIRKLKTKIYYLALKYRMWFVIRLISVVKAKKERSYR